MIVSVEILRAHAPFLLVALPLGGAALAAAIPHARTSWLVGCVAALAAAVLAADLWRGLLSGAQTLRESSFWALDGVARFAAPLLAICSLLVVVALGARLRDAGARTGPFVVALALTAASGWIGALLARDLAGLFLAVETAWLASVGLVALSPQRGALNGALRMLSVGGVAAALFLLGAAMIGRSVGMELAALPVVHVEAPALAAVGAALIVVAIALKAGLAPLHAWMGAAYGRSSGAAVLALGVLGAVGALAVLVRFAGYAIPAPAIGGGVSAALAALGGASAVIGAAQAVGASNVPRLAGYALAAQAGGVLVSAALGSPAGYAAALIQLFALAAAALALIGGAAAAGVRTLATLDGLGRRAPLAAAAMTASAISLMGAPLTIGFLGRWRLVEAGIGAGWWWTAGVMIVTSLAGVFYGGRLVERLYFKRAETTFAGGGDLWRVAFAPALIVAIAAIALGVAPALLLDAAAQAAAHVAEGRGA